MTRPGNIYAKTPADVHREWLSGALTNGEFVFELARCGADDETVRREIPDSALLEDYFEYMRRKRSPLASSFRKTVGSSG